MKRNASDYILAFTVTGCSAVLLAALTVALSGYRFRAPARTVDIDFPDISGIKLHSEVRYAGAPAGRVIAVRHLTPEERAGAGAGKFAVRVTASIEKTVPPLPIDVQASLGSDTLLSEKFVALSGGKPGGPVLANGSRIFASGPSGLDALLASAGPLLKNADDMVIDLHTQLGVLLPKLDALLGSADSMIGGGRTTLIQANGLLEKATKLLADNEGDIHGRLVELKTVLSSLNDVLGRANGFVGSTEKDLQARLEELRVVLLNLKVVTTHAKSITQTLGEKPSRLIWGFGKKQKLPTEEEIIKSPQPVSAGGR